MTVSMTDIIKIIVFLRETSACIFIPNLEEITTLSWLNSEFDFKKLLSLSMLFYNNLLFSLVTTPLFSILFKMRVYCYFQYLLIKNRISIDFNQTSIHRYANKVLYCYINYYCISKERFTHK